ncbi:MAG TPA: CU044_2847 family protein [Thermoanaerobaculia bacterium]|nr:CU044_2847 family protein [Thermoanaerobaculia bacterium]
MSHLVKMQVGAGIEVAVEVPDRMEPASFDVGLPTRVEKGLEDALDFVAEFAKSAAARLNAALASAAPDEVTLEFGVVVGTEAGVILTSASVQGQLKVSLKWKRAGS